MKRISLRKLGRNKRKKETQSDEENSGEQPGSSRVDTVETRTHQTDEGETDTAEILDLSNVSARTPHIDNNNRQMHSIMPSPQPELIASHQGLVPIYDPIRAQMNTSNNSRNTPVYTQQMYPHPSMLQGAQGASYPHYNAIAYNQEMAMQPTTSHHPSTQFRDEHFNLTGDFAVGYRAYQTGRAQAENSDATAYNRQAMMQPATSHQPWTQFREQPGPSRVDTVEKRTHQTDEGETDTAEILDLSNVSARTSHIDNNNTQMHSWLPSSKQELIASHQGYVPIYDPIRAQMNTSNNGRNTPVYTQQMYPHPSMLQGALGASYPHYNSLVYNQQMMSQPTTSHHVEAQLREQHFNPTGVFAVENRAYQAGRAQAGNSDVTAYNQQAMMQLSTHHHAWTQFRPGSTNQLRRSTNDPRYTPMHVEHCVNDDLLVHQQAPAQPSTSQLGQTASNRNSVTRRIEVKITGEKMQCENFIVGTDTLHFDNRQTSSQAPYVSQTDPPSHTELTARNQFCVALQRLRKILKDYIERECRGPVTEHYDDLKEPTKEVYPKLLELLRFYEGDLLKMIMSQYQIDPAFEYERKDTSSGEELDYETFLRRIIKTETKRISVIAQAGSGKTVMLKRLARDLAKHNDELLVFFMNFRDFTDSKEITPCDFLINGRLPDSDAKHSYEWILENQDKVMLVLDGLDQATWDIDEKAKMIGDYGTGKVSEIVSSIFKGKLFPDIKVVYSSREHAVASLKGQLRPKMVFALTGLSPGDAEWLFKSFVGENQEILWDKLRTQSHSLIPLFSIPAFLIFTAIVYVKKPENPPRSMTEVLKNLLEIFMRSGHIMEKDCFRVLAGLKKMSFVGMMNGKVLFYIENVRNAGLNAEQICDWIITIPGLNRCNQFLLEGEYVLMFSHQTIQEFLAAQYIIEMDFKSFQTALVYFLKKSEWLVVTRFVFGLLFNDEISVNLTTDDVKQKRNALKSMMVGKRVWTSLDWLAVISESNHNVFIRDLVHEIALNLVLGDSGAYVIASVMRHLVHLNQLCLLSCHLTSGNLQILRDNIENSSLKISKLDITSNMEDKGYATLGKIVKMCAVDQLQLGFCTLSDGKLRNLLSETDGAKISKLYIPGNSCMEDEGYATLGKIVKMCAVDELWLQTCNLSDGKLKNLLSETDGAKISKFDVSYNHLNEDTAAVLGDIVKRCSVEELIMLNCQLNDGSMKALLSRSSGAKISKLYIPYNSDMEDEGYATLGKIVKMCAVDELWLHNCDLSDGKLKNLLSETDGAKISKLEVSSNSLNEDTAAVLGDIVKRCSVEELSMRDCGLNDGSLKTLLSRSSGAKLSAMDVRNNRAFFEGGFNILSAALLDEISCSITVKHSDYYNV